MKTFILSLLFTGFVNYSFAQMHAVTAGRQEYGTARFITPTTANDNIRMRVDDRTDLNEESVVDGETVGGTPLLINGWVTGSLYLKDGRNYTNYKLEYDIYHQAVMFLSGATAMTVEDEINKFMLNDGKRVMEFVNGVTLDKKAEPGFYEVLLSGEKGKLLEFHQKTIETNTTSVVDAARQRQFKYSPVYYYYNEEKKTLKPFKLTNEGIAKALKIEEIETASLIFYPSQEETEKELIGFFTKYVSH